jgi:hypothetical protein
VRFMPQQPRAIRGGGGNSSQDMATMNGPGGTENVWATSFDGSVPANKNFFACFWNLFFGTELVRVLQGFLSVLTYRVRVLGRADERRGRAQA